LGLLRLSFIATDQAFDGFVKTWSGPPISVELTNASDCVERSGLRERKTSGLPGLNWGPSAAGPAPAALRVLRARLPIIFGRDI